jgi:hypothetical protein
MELNNYKVIELSKLVKADWNYKEDDHEIAKKLKKNIENNGQIENLIVRNLGNGTWEVINGNHRLDVMHDLGLKTAMCCDLGMISLQQAKRVAIETNETKFPNDPLKLMEVIKDLGSTFEVEDLSLSLPYTEDEIKFFIEHEPTETPVLTEDEFFEGTTQEEKDNEDGVIEGKPKTRQKKPKIVPAQCPQCQHNFDVEVVL